MSHGIAFVSSLVRRRFVCRCGGLHPCERNRPAPVTHPPAPAIARPVTDPASGQLPRDTVLALRPGDYWEPYGLALFLTDVTVDWGAPGRYDHGVFVQVDGVELRGRRRTVYVREEVLQRIGAHRPAVFDDWFAQ